MCGYFQRLRQVRDRSGGYYVVFSSSAFGFGSDNCRIELKRFADLVEKLGAKSPRLDERDWSIDQAGNNDSGQSGTRSNVCPGSAWVRLEPHKLGGIEDVPLPQVIESRGGDQVLPSRLLSKQGRVVLKLLERFT
jgi:hypothetical protein